MRHLFFILFFTCLAGSTTKAQSSGKVSWTFSAKKITANQYEVILSATIQRGWHLYSQKQTQDAIALPTAIRFVNNPLVVKQGGVQERGKLIAAFDKATNSNSRFYSDKVDFVQTVTLKTNVKTAVSGEVEFMVCDDKQCLPPERVKFSVKL